MQSSRRLPSGGSAPNTLRKEDIMHVADKDLVSVLSQPAGAPQLVAAVYARVTSPAGFARRLGPLGNYLVARPAARTAAHRASERTDVPLDAAVILGLAPGALHVWSADPMTSHVHDHLGSVETARIAGIRAETGKSWWPLTITFPDGGPLELQARGDVSGFVAAFEEQQRASAPGT
jgi:hypothetical protein